MTRVVQAYLFRAQLLTTRFRFDEAEGTYEAAIAVAPDSFLAWFTFGCFSQKLNHLTKAWEEYSHALELARESATKPNIAAVLNNMEVCIFPRTE